MEPARDNTTGERYCSNCGLTKKTANGYWKIAPNGKNRRWMCAPCSTKRLNVKK